MQSAPRALATSIFVANWEVKITIHEEMDMNILSELIEIGSAFPPWIQIHMLKRSL